MTGPLPPNSTLGVLGGGQLGRMFRLAAEHMGYRVKVFAAGDATVGAGDDPLWTGSFDDLERIEAFARGVDALTFEFENIPSATAEAAAKHTPVRPSGSLLHTTQDRIREKTRLQGLGLPVARFAAIHEATDLGAAAAQIPGAGILKTASWGYDGHGQVRLASADALPSAWESLRSQPAVYEELVPLQKEISVVGARGLKGQIELFEPFENMHEAQILDVTLWPARVRPATRDQARDIATTILREMDVVGVLCVEFFVLDDGSLVVNELAPRPHNSGHLTIETHHCSQFEQQVRAVAGLPLGTPDSVTPCGAMANLLGDLWKPGEPDWPAALSQPGVHLHLYGKVEPRERRKMGHLTATGDDLTGLEARLRAIRQALHRA